MKPAPGWEFRSESGLSSVIEAYFVKVHSLGVGPSWIFDFSDSETNLTQLLPPLPRGLEEVEAEEPEGLHSTPDLGKGEGLGLVLALGNDRLNLPHGLNEGHRRAEFELEESQMGFPESELLYFRAEESQVRRREVKVLLGEERGLENFYPRTQLSSFRLPDNVLGLHELNLLVQDLYEVLKGEGGSEVR